MVMEIVKLHFKTAIFTRCVTHDVNYEHIDVVENHDFTMSMYNLIE